MITTFSARWAAALVLVLMTFTVSWASSNEFTGHYNRGLDYFSQHRYEDARDELFMAMAFRENDPDTLKHLALASFMVEDYPLARNLAAQYLDISEDADVLVLLGRASELNGDKELAANIYRKLATTSNPYKQASQEALRRLLGDQPQISRFPRPEGWHGSVIAAFENDSNVTTTYNETNGRGSAIKDNRASLIMAADYDTPVGEDYYVGYGGLAYGNLYNDDAQPYETGLVRGNLHAGMVGQGWNLKFALEYDYVDYGHEEEFSAVRLAATLIKMFSDRYVVLLQGSIADEDWVDGKSDSIRFDISADNRYYFNEVAPNTYARLKYHYQHNDTNDPSTDAYYFDKGTVGFRATIPSWSNIYIAPDVSFERRIYDDLLTFAREDEITEYSVVLGKSWSKQLSTELLYRYKETDSNISLYDKIQRVYGLSMINTF